MGFLFLLVTTFVSSVQAQYFTLHLIPSPHGIHWEKPQSLAESVIRNQFGKTDGARHSIGHVYIELNCGGESLYTGMTSSIENEDRDALLKHQIGLGVVLRNYAGKLEESQQVRSDLLAMQKNGRSSFLSFLISPSTCARLENYLSEYRARGFDQIYGGLNARPLLGQGSGCSAFGASFLELSGLQIPEFETKWTQSLIIPRRFVGGESTHRRVNVFQLLLAVQARWDQGLGAKGFPIHFWDPEKMNAWVRAAYSQLKNGKGFPVPWVGRASQQGSSPGVVFDARSVPTPQGEIFRISASHQ